MKVTSWGKYPVVEGKLSPLFPGQLPGDVPVEGNWIPRGMGRSYGDASLGKTMVSCLKLNRFLDFDPQTGLLTCESGVTFDDILTHFVPKGWFPPVVPGTKFVSMGGAVASDVHGKNHHLEGAFSNHLVALDLLLADGRVIRCSRSENPEIFAATCGGMGLTGMILRLTLRLKPVESAAVSIRSFKAGNLDEVLSLFEMHQEATYSVAWIDCLRRGKKAGRSILMTGEHAVSADLKRTKWETDPFRNPAGMNLRVPIDLPGFVLNHWSIEAFNFLYYHKHLRREEKKISGYHPFFFPLDAIQNWNRIYGKRGFTQYQFVVPKSGGEEVIRLILSYVRKARMGAFLSVLKLFGKQEGILSFPMEGYTLTLDFPISDRLFPFLDKLDAIVAEAGGRVYLTKDVRLKAEMLEKMYPGLSRFREILHTIDPAGQIRSLQSDRLGIHPAIPAHGDLIQS